MPCCIVGATAAEAGRRKTRYDIQTSERDELYRQSKLNAVPSSSSFV